MLDELSEFMHNATFVVMKENDNGYPIGQIACIQKISTNVLQNDGSWIDEIWTLLFPDGDVYHALPDECEPIHIDRVWIDLEAEPYIFGLKGED